MPAGAEVRLDCQGARFFTHGSDGPLTVAAGGVLRLSRCLVDTAPSISHGRAATAAAALQAFGTAQNITVEMRQCEARLRETVWPFVFHSTRYRLSQRRPDSLLSMHVYCTANTYANVYYRDYGGVLRECLKQRAGGKFN